MKVNKKMLLFPLGLTMICKYLIIIQSHISIAASSCNFALKILININNMPKEISDKLIKCVKWLVWLLNVELWVRI